VTPPLLGLLLKLLKLSLDFCNAILANAVFVEEMEIFYTAAENTTGRVFLQNDAAVIGKDLDSIASIPNVKRLSHFRGENDASQIIDFSNDAR
jgi:hypothetical protein